MGMDSTNSSPPTHSISFPDKIVAFELSSYEWSQNLLCVALADKLILGVVRFPVNVWMIVVCSMAQGINKMVLLLSGGK